MLTVGLNPFKPATERGAIDSSSMKYPQKTPKKAKMQGMYAIPLCKAISNAAT